MEINLKVIPIKIVLVRFWGSSYYHLIQFRNTEEYCFSICKKCFTPFNSHLMDPIYSHNSDRICKNCIKALAKQNFTIFDIKCVHISSLPMICQKNT